MQFVFSRYPGIEYCIWKSVYMHPTQHCTAGVDCISDCTHSSFSFQTRLRDGVCEALLVQNWLSVMLRGQLVSGIVRTFSLLLHMPHPLIHSTHHCTRTDCGVHPSTVPLSLHPSPPPLHSQICAVWLEGSLPLPPPLHHALHAQPTHLHPSLSTLADTHTPTLPHMLPSSPAGVANTAPLFSPSSALLPSSSLPLSLSHQHPCLLQREMHTSRQTCPVIEGGTPRTSWSTPPPFLLITEVSSHASLDTSLSRSTSNTSIQC